MPGALRCRPRTVVPWQVRSELLAVVPRSSKGTSGMQAHAGRSTSHLHMPQHELILAEDIDSLDALCSTCPSSETLMF